MTGTEIKCKFGHDMRLINVHLKSVAGTTNFTPLHGAGAGLKLVKVFKCGLCDQVDEVSEEVA